MKAGTAEAGVLYAARVSHRRRIAPLYRFVYRVGYALWDVDRIDEAVRGLHFASYNRFNLLSVHDADHGDGTRGGLRRWAESLLREAGIEPDGGRIRLLALPRVLGFAFNPIAMWYCEDRAGRLQALIAEVNNTFGEKHCYLLDARAREDAASTSEALAYEQPLFKDKCFHVSPFLEVAGRYRFVLSEPGERLRLAIHESRDGLPVLDAVLAAERRPLNDTQIMKWVLGMPWMTLKVVAGIHWEALKIWLRGAGFHSKPAPPAQPVT